VNALPSAQNTARLDTSHLQRGAQQLGDMANRYFEQQMQLADDAAIMEARNALSQWEGSINDPANPQGRFAYQGKNALQAGDALLPKADAEIGRLRQSLTPRQQAKFDALAGNFRAQFQEGINRWSTQQFQGYEDATYKATVENLTSDAVASGLQGDFTRQANVANELLMINRSHLQTRGMGEELIKASERGLVSGIHANTVTGMLTGDPMSAQAYYARWADQMQPEDRAKVERALAPIMNDVEAGARFDAWLGNDRADPNAGIDPGQRGKPSDSIAAILNEEADAAGVPREYLYALAEQESSFNPNAVNPEVLDDGDNATGLFQYHASSAGNIDRKDARASARRAAKEFRERMDRGGVDFAVAAHFAGDGGAEAVVKRGRTAENPKTALYIQQVRGRASRWRQGLGLDSTVPTVANPGAPRSRAEERRGGN